MPESKRNFLKGKMNKDLDERLVPNGEYRDALNIEISTSEGSDKGVAQTTLGNRELIPSRNINNNKTISSEAVTVGNIVDETNNYIYEFISGSLTLAGDGTGFKADAIVRWNPNGSYQTDNNFSGFDTIVSDVYEVRHVPAAFDTPTIVAIPSSVRSKIRVGMRVQAISSNGSDLWAGADINVKNISQNGNVILTNLTGFEYTSQNISDGVVIKFSADRVLNFIDGDNLVAANVAGTPSSQTPDGNLITGINLSGDFLMFTDGRNEPKKVNILRSLSGTSSLNQHTKLWIEVNGVLQNTGYWLKEEHISVIRKNPNTAPTVSSSVDLLGNPLSVDIIGCPLVLGGVGVQNASNNIPNPTASYGVFRLAENDGTPFIEGRTYYISTLQDTNYAVDSTLRITGKTTATTAFLTIIEAWSNTYKVVVQSIPAGYTGDTFEFWSSTIVSSSTFYSDTFIYFAYRYTYTDNEKSCISPFSASTFLPGRYSYDPKDGFNLGAENIFDEINVRNFIPVDIPEDVVSVELLIKTTDNENVYATRVIDRDTEEWDAQGDGRNHGNITFDSEITGTALPTDQLLRPYDAVPRTAKAQEFSAGRLIYGNYVEDYDLVDGSGEVITPTIFSGSEAVSNTFEEDIQSDNNMKLFRAQSPGVGGGYWNQNLKQFRDADSGVADINLISESISVYGLYCGADSQYDPGNNMTISGSGTVATPYKYYYTAPTTGSYTFNINVAARTIRWNQASNSVGDLYSWGLAIFECDTNGQALSLQSPGGFTNAIPASQIAISPYAVLANGLDTLNVTPALDNNNPNIMTVPQTIVWNPTVTLTSGKHYQVFLVSRRTDLYGQNVDGTIGAFAYNGLADQTTLLGDPISGATPKQMQIANAAIDIVTSPSTTNTLASSLGTLSVKSDRDYSIGVLYRDSYGRESSVLVDEKRDFNLAKTFAPNKNFLNAVVRHNAPYWADTYKFFIKESSSKYYNLVMDAAFANNDGAYAWLVFNSSDRNKVQVGDVLKMKKKQGTNVAVTDEEAKWKIVDIQNEGSQTNEAGEEFEASVGGVTIPQTVIASAAELIGKFFVKVSNDTNFSTYVGDFSTLTTISNSNGAVFETDPKSILDLDLYYEVGGSYPIRLEENTAELYIPVGSTVTFTDIWYANNDGNTFYNPNGTINTTAAEELLTSIQSSSLPSQITVLQVRGALSFPTSLSQLLEQDYNCIVTLDWPGFNFAGGNNNVYTSGLVATINRPDGSYTTVQMLGSISGNKMRVVPFTHPTSEFSTVKSKIQLPWSNCIAFGNGVESDTIRDDFNEVSMWNYTANGKTSGFKASIQQDDYSENKEENQLIYSQVFNEDAGVNKLNQFLAAQNIVKKVNPENGSIQKLFSRDTNLVIFCESKVFRGPINKDVIFNADGNGQLVTSNKVIGTLTPYSSGDYGISTNPESFAADEFRMYFADKKRGAVLRLSNDGLTPIHEYGMEDWFNDHLGRAKALVGSYDDRKGEYNLTVHESIANGKKDVYTLSFSELVNGWSSFKSFIQEQGVSLNNQYFTFSKGDLYVHHNEYVNRNQYYGVDHDSTLTTLINDAPSSVKHFKALDYEGSQARVVARLENGQYYDEFAKNGWYVESINTDQQEGKINTFVEKEGKWFNSIQGLELIFNNSGSGNTALNNIDTSEFSVQGVGQLSVDASVVSGVAPSSTFNVNVTPTTTGTFSGQWTSDGLQEYLPALVVDANNTFTISPGNGWAISAENFSVSTSNSYYTGVVFTDNGTPGTQTNTVTASITWIAQTLSADAVFSIAINQADIVESGKSAHFSLDVNHLTSDANRFEVAFLPGTTLDTTFSSSSTLSATYSRDRYTLSSNNVLPNVNTTFANFSITAAPGFVFNTSSISETGFNPSPSPYQGSLILTGETSNLSTATTSKTYSFSGALSEDVTAADNYRAIVNPGVFEPITAAWAGSPVVTVDNDELTFNHLVASNGDTPTFTISAGTWITGVAAQPYSDDTITGYQVSITVANNAGASRNATVNVFSSYDTAQSSPVALVVIQDAADYVNSYQSNIDGTFLSDSAFNTNRLPGQFSIFVTTNGNVPVTGDFTFVYNSGASGWISFASVIESPFFSGETESGQATYQVFFNKLINDTVTPNVATITSAHSSGSPTNTIVVTQLRAYNPAVDTVKFVNASGAEITTIAAANYNAEVITGYLLSANADFAPTLVSEFEDLGLNESAVSHVEFSNIQAVSGAPYTHTYQINILSNLSANDLSINGEVFYNAEFPSSSNQTSNADDSIAITQGHYEIGSFYFANTASPYGTANDFVPSGNNPALIPEYDFTSTALRWGVNYNTSGGALFDKPFFQATTGYALKYIAFDNIGISDVYGENFDWETLSGGTAFNAGSKPSWMSDVAITTVAAAGGDYLDGTIAFKLSTNSGAFPRIMAIGLFSNGNTTNIPDSELYIIQENS